MLKCKVLGGPKIYSIRKSPERRAIRLSGVAKMSEHESFDAGIRADLVDPIGPVFPPAQSLAPVAHGVCPPVERGLLPSCSKMILIFRIRGEL